MEIFQLDRFIQAQGSSNTYETALKEVKEGQKRSHWIWYIFPQIDGMGHSSTSKFYGIKSLGEAKAYFENNILRDRLYEITRALLEQNDSAQNIFGDLDAMKVCSCMTLFDLVSPDDVFAKVLEKFYEGKKCQRTLSILRNEIDKIHSEDKKQGVTDRIYNDIKRPMYTPEKLSSLKDDEIFVFGSNLSGAHGGGAARAAMMRFGAVWGQGVGLQGQSYAIPTMQGGVETIKPYVDEFINFARSHKDMFFYVTRLGCGIAGFKDEDIAPLFAETLSLNNVCLPKSFCDILKENAFANTSSMLIAYGQVRTMADILIELDKTEHFSNSRSAIEAVEEYIRKQEEGHMNISAHAFSILANTLENDYCFVDGHLDDHAVKCRFEYEHLNKRSSHRDGVFATLFGFKPIYEEAMFKYCYAKIWKLICFLNDFRRYSNPQEIQNDLQKLDLRDYFEMGGPAGDYPKYFFRRTIDEAWGKIAPHGNIDERCLKTYMFENHEMSLRAIGLEETINRDFEMDYCHSDVFFPKNIGTAPVYVEKKNEYGRRFVKSCGEGKGLNQFHEAFEFRYAEKLLWNDTNYDVYGEYNCYSNYIPMYFVPKYDRTLPVYQISYNGEKMYFKSVSEQNDFYDKALVGLQVASQKEIDEFNQYRRV